ncbi:MAG: TonB-dependent receptor [Mariniphaga sp.]
MSKFIVSYICLIWYSLLFAMAQNPDTGIKGRVVDELNHPVEMVNILIKGTTIGTVTNSKGEFTLPLIPKRLIVVIFSAVGFEKTERTVELPGSQPLFQVLKTNVNRIGEIVVEKKRENNNLQTIEPKLTERLPSIGGSVETIIKTLPGVSSNNELSSQYSVRGGNFDENLVYVNGIEIIRPFLVKSGEQEGLSFINSEMVSTIGFSAGGFDASYGDKMSSVLDITYRKPLRNSAFAEVGALGGSVLVEGTGAGAKFSHMTGIRYKNTAYLLGTLDKKGEYNPSFTDFQTSLNYQFSSRFKLGFIGNYAKNTFQFIPKTQLTRFGTVTNPYQFMVYFDGREKDLFENYMGALAADFAPNDKLMLRLQASSFHAYENISNDILGEYYLSDVSQQTGSGSSSDSTTISGTGSDLVHTRNRLIATVNAFEHRATYTTGHYQFQWGVKYQYERVADHINEWQMRDSAGYSIPYNNSDISLYRSRSGDSQITSSRFSGFFKQSWSEELGNGAIGITAGVRFQNWDYNHQTIFSPRISASWKTGNDRSQTFRAAWGVYDQMPFFKELLNQEARIIPGVKAQKAVHYLISYDKIINVYERPIHFSAELWYKSLNHLIPYQTNNLNIQYLPEQVAKGYSKGIDFKINGELASGAQSWASLTFMQTEEDIVGDSYLKKLSGGETHLIYPGYIPRPTDQRVNFSLFIQDYFPGYPTVKMNMTLFYGSKLPFGPPNGVRYMDTFRMPPYQRVDAGFSKTLIDKNKTISQSGNKYKIKEAWIGFEIFNLFDINNTISYYWITDIHNQMYAVPNYLTGRRLNLKFSVRF